MSDYKSDLESLKNSMKLKDQEDKNIFDALAEEKNQRELLYQKALQEIKDLKDLEIKLKDKDRMYEHLRDRCHNLENVNNELRSTQNKLEKDNEKVILKFEEFKRIQKNE